MKYTAKGVHQFFMCGQKIRYGTEEAAKKVIRKMRKVVIDPTHLEAYRCSICDGWHIGNNRKGVVKPV